MVHDYKKLWRVVTFFSRFIGLYPLNDFDYNISIMWGLYSLLFTVPSFSRATFIPLRISTMHSFLEHLNYVVTCICALLSPFKTVIMREKLKQLFLTLDSDVVPKDLNYSYSVIITAICRFLIALIPTIIFKLIRSKSFPALFWFTLFQINIICLQFNILLSFFIPQFHYINETLKEGNCHQLIIIHNRLIDSCTLLNELYSHQLLLIIFHLVVSLVDNVTTTMKPINDIILNENPDVAVLLLYLCYDIYCLIHFRAIIDNCTLLSNKGNLFNKRLYKMLLITQKEDLLKDEKLLIQLMRRRKLEFKACSMFPLDYTTYHSALATCFTYLILMYQISELD